MPDDPLARFQALLRELFQFESQDLDFGIYRVLNLKRRQIEDFIDRRLPQIVEETFASHATADREVAESRFSRVREQYVLAFGEETIDSHGEIPPTFASTPLGIQYESAREMVEAAQQETVDKAGVYNDLYTFFNRYYEDGDFIPKRRRGRDSNHAAYAVPYNGEEVFLHWANRDQYYVKTGERFAAYRFEAGGFRVAFELRRAETDLNSNKGGNRYFVLASQDPARWDPEEQCLTLFFEHRALTPEEEQAFGRTENQRPQEKLNEDAAARVLDAVPEPALKEALTREANGGGQTLLARHLGRYARKNTSDFFVHKDLGGFLRRELDHYLKNEALLLDELLATGEAGLRRNLKRARALRDVGHKIIDFLAQVEDFQRRLFEKKKFVVATEYCATLDRVRRDLYPEIAANDAQREEWKRLFAIEEIKQDAAGAVAYSEPLTVDFLEANPYLVLDTRFFGPAFKERLLASFDDLDASTDGLLVQSENFQALRLLEGRYAGQVQCIYIDPPYNTGPSEILYKNDYKHSSWLSLIHDRVTVGMGLLRHDGVACVTIDDCEASRLQFDLEEVIGPENHLGTVVIRNNPQGRSTVKGFAINHEYAVFFGRGSAVATIGRLERSDAQVARYDQVDEDGRLYLWENLRKTGTDSDRGDRPKQHYPIYFAKGRVRIPSMRWDEAREMWVDIENPRRGERVIWPRNELSQDKVWKWGHERLAGNLDKIKVDERGGSIQVYVRYYLNAAGSLPGTWWDAPRYAAGSHGTNLLTAMFGSGRQFLFPKSVHAVGDSLRVCGANSHSTVLDFFAGSGTTGHAVINLNRDDGGGRRFILVEMGDYFDTVLKPRIAKVVYSKDWREGKPVLREGSSHLLKYLHLEQYEDTLNNIEVTQAAEGQMALEEFGEEYLLRYMLEFETRGSASLLSVRDLDMPFSYQLKVQRTDGTVETRPVDLVETFNYLLGLHVKRVRAFRDGDRPYRAVYGEKEGKRIAVVWRDARDLPESDAALKRDRAFIQETVLPGLLDPGVQPDRLFLNGAWTVKGAEAIEPEFHRLMFAEVA